MPYSFQRGCGGHTIARQAKATAVLQVRSLRDTTYAHIEGHSAHGTLHQNLKAHPNAFNTSAPTLRTKCRVFGKLSRPKLALCSFASLRARVSIVIAALELKGGMGLSVLRSRKLCLNR